MGFWYLVQKTPLGRAQRAREQDRKMVSLLGIDVDRTISLTFRHGRSRSPPSPVSCVHGLLRRVSSDASRPAKVFTAAVLPAASTSLPGAATGGLLIGLIEVIWSAYFTTIVDYKRRRGVLDPRRGADLHAQGILGKPEVEKV